MNYQEEIRDLFTVPDDYYLAHCISPDFKMGAGIAVEFSKRYNMKTVLTRKYPDFLQWYQRNQVSGICILEGRTFNLVTKERYYPKPTIATMRGALLSMHTICKEKGITKIAMPMIGCGLDRLDWSAVSASIKEIFDDTDVEILVCRQGNGMEKLIETAIRNEVIDFEPRYEDDNVTIEIGELEILIYPDDDPSIIWDEKYMDAHASIFAKQIYNELEQERLLDPVNYGYARDWLFSHTICTIPEKEAMAFFKDIYLRNNC